MIFITSKNTIVNISQTIYTRDSLFYEAVHIAFFKKPLTNTNFTSTITKTIDKYYPPYHPSIVT